jgi:F0F1-type ATP synthase assembly protein I
MNRYLVFTSIGFELLGIMLGAIYLGQAIDQKYQTKGMALIALMFIGLASWLTHVVLLLRKFQKEDATEEEDSKK